MEYIVIVLDDLALLCEAVNRRIPEGYHPIGGIAVVHISEMNERKGYAEDRYEYYQAMMKEFR